MRNHFLALTAISVACLAANGASPANGYYRLKNYKTERYARVVDDKGSVSYTSTTADLEAIELLSGFENVFSDPSSVLYVEKAGSGTYTYNITAQGMSMYSVLDQYINVLPNSSISGTYYAYGTYSGVTEYIGDPTTNMNYTLTYPSTNSSGEYRLWCFVALDETADAGFGVKPTIEVGGKHYASFYAGFPFTPKSEGMKVYYVSAVHSGQGAAVLTEISGTVPAGTPVIIECASADPAQNLLSIGGTGSAVSGSKLGGNYFENHAAKHINRKEYDSKSMRVLSIGADGSLAFVDDETLEYLPMNSAYLKVGSWCESEVKFVTQEEFDLLPADEAPEVDDPDEDDPIEDNPDEGEELGIGGIEVGTSVSSYDVYTITGQAIRRRATGLEGLQPGIYIVNGQKIAL